MPRRTLVSSEAELKTIATPNHGSRYTVISHGLIIDTIKTELQKNNIGIVKEVYRSTADGQIATGTVWLSRTNDPDISMMISWTNSYNKMVRFMSVVGGYVHANESHIVGNNLTTFSRKHTGDADKEAIETIENQISKAAFYFNNLVKDKDLMKQVVLTKQEQAELAGRLFIEFEYINKEQLGIVRDQIHECKFHYNSDPNSVWAFYNHFNYALIFGHPKTWMVQQSQLHNFLINYINSKSNSVSVTTTLADSTTEISETIKNEELNLNQLDLFDAIAEAENAIAETEEVLDDTNISSESCEEVSENPKEQIAEAFQNYKEKEEVSETAEEDKMFDLDDLDFFNNSLDLSDL